MVIGKWIKAAGLVVLSAATLATLSGAAYERLSRADASEDFPAPGRLVDIGGGRKMQIDCRGSGSPTVVFESGLDIYGSLAWTAVHDSVAGTTRACAYSRAGVMWSDPSPPFDVDRTASDLHAALVNSGEAAPWVLVGHSLGGAYVATFTSRYPAEVAGLVMVDVSHPDQFTRYAKVAGKSIAPEPGVFKLGAKLSWTGLVRLLPQPPEPQSWPGEMHQASAFLPLSIRGLAGEVSAVHSSLEREGRAKAMGDRPFVVLCAGKPASAADLKALQLTAAQGQAIHEAHLELCQDMATWSTRGRLRVVEGASHYIQIDRPDAVIAAVKEVLAGVIASSSTAPNARRCDAKGCA